MSGLELCRYPVDQEIPAAADRPTTRMVRALHCRLTVRLSETEGRTYAAVAGEVDLDCTETLRHVLEDSLRHAPAGMDLDLSGVDFFDCSGLNVLLRLRALAHDLDAPLTLSGAPHSVTRVLDITRTRALFEEAAKEAGAGAAAEGV